MPSVGEETADWESALVSMLEHMVADGSVPLTLEGDDGWQRDVSIDVGDDARRLTEPGMLFEGMGFRPFGPADLPADIGRVEDDGPAKSAGLQVGDRIVGIDGEEVTDFQDLVDLVQPRANKEVTIEFLRSGQRLSTTLVVQEQVVEGQVRGRLGVARGGDFDEYYYQRPLRARGIADACDGAHMDVDRVYAAHAGPNADRRCVDQEHQRSHQYCTVCG